MIHYRVAAFIIAGLVLIGGASFASANGWDRSTMSGEPPSELLPGNYFDYKAQFCLKKEDYAFALAMFQSAGYWANRRGH